MPTTPTKRRRGRPSATHHVEENLLKGVLKGVSTTKKNDHPLKGTMALGIVAVLVGLTIGGYIASRYFKPQQSRPEVSPDLVEQLAARLAQDIVEDKEVQDVQARVGRVETIAPVSLEPETESDEVEATQEPTLKRYVNEYFGMTFTFPFDWVYTEQVGIVDAQTTLGDFASSAIDLSLSVIEIPRFGFKGFVQNQLTTQADVDAWAQEIVRKYTELFPDQEPLVLGEVPFENGALRIGGHDARVDVVTPPVLPGEAVRTVRRFWLNAGRGHVVAMRFVSPAFIPSEEQPNDPYAAVMQMIVESVAFFDDGIGDTEEWTLPAAQTPENAIVE